MDEKKSVLTNNQVMENLEQNFQFAKWTNGENVSDAATKQYNRDILLQLRLHPLSLQKPRELPEMEFIKDKLYLDDIADMTSTSSEKHIDTSNYHKAGKSDYYNNVKPDFSLSPYFSKMYPYCYSSHAHNGSYQNAPVKCRSSFNSYSNPLKKHCIAAHQCLKDISLEEYPWTKPFPSPDDVWNCYSNHAHCGFYKRKDHSEAVPKSRKKLQIIDPVTGKNILETVLSDESEEPGGDGFCGTKENNDKAAEPSKSEESTCDSLTLSSGDNPSFDKPNSSDVKVNVNNDRLLENNVEETCNNASSTIDNNKNTGSENQKEGNHEILEVKNNVYDFTKTSEKTFKYEPPKYSKQVTKMSRNREMSTQFDVHSTCRAHSIKECHMHACKENLSKQHDAMQESLRQLKEKICTLKQEEQKVAILQSFLRYKKYQLEESARSLDEKRIEIANREYNLYNKAKRLHEKELWLENKNEILNNKTQQLVEKEKMMNEEEKISGDALYSNTFKESNVPEKKFPFDNNNIWNEISKMKNPRINDNNEYFVRYESKSTKVPEMTSPNIEKCKSDAFSFDELEKSLAFIEKMHSSSEANDSPADKIELVSSPNTIHKNDENSSYDPLGYSKGRRYLPEHMKYWLDKRDKNAL